MGPDRTGFLVTEERIGASTVVSTLGFLPTPGRSARQRLRERAAELAQQRYRPPVFAARLKRGALLALAPGGGHRRFRQSRLDQRIVYDRFDLPAFDAYVYVAMAESPRSSRSRPGAIASSRRWWSTRCPGAT